MHIGLDAIQAQLAGYRHTVVTIKNKIDLANLVQFHRWNTGQVHGSYLNSGPALFSTVLSRQKAARKVTIPPHAADNLLEGHIPQAAWQGCASLELLAHIFVREQISGTAGQPSQNLLPGSLIACPSKISDRRG